MEASERIFYSPPTLPHPHPHQQHPHQHSHTPALYNNPSPFESPYPRPSMSSTATASAPTQTQTQTPTPTTPTPAPTTPARPIHHPQFPYLHHPLMPPPSVGGGARHSVSMSASTSRRLHSQQQQQHQRHHAAYSVGGTLSSCAPSSASSVSSQPAHRALSHVPTASTPLIPPAFRAVLHEPLIATVPFPQLLHPFHHTHFPQQQPTPQRQSLCVGRGRGGQVQKRARPLSNDKREGVAIPRAVVVGGSGSAGLISEAERRIIAHFGAHNTAQVPQQQLHQHRVLPSAHPLLVSPPPLNDATASGVVVSDAVHAATAVAAANAAAAVNTFVFPHAHHHRAAQNVAAMPPEPSPRVSPLKSRKKSRQMVKEKKVRVKRKRPPSMKHPNPPSKRRKPPAVIASAQTHIQSVVGSGNTQHCPIAPAIPKPNPRPAREDANLRQHPPTACNIPARTPAAAAAAAATTTASNTTAPTPFPSTAASASPSIHIPAPHPYPVVHPAVPPTAPLLPLTPAPAVAVAVVQQPLPAPVTQQQPTSRQPTCNRGDASTFTGNTPPVRQQQQQPASVLAANAKDKKQNKKPPRRYANGRFMKKNVSDELNARDARTLENTPAASSLLLPPPGHQHLAGGANETHPRASDTSAAKRVQVNAGANANTMNNAIAMPALKGQDRKSPHKLSIVSGDARAVKEGKDAVVKCASASDKKRMKSNSAKKKKNNNTTGNHKKNTPTAISTAALAPPKISVPSSNTNHVDPQSRKTPSVPVVVVDGEDDDDTAEDDDDDIPIAETARKKASPTSTPERSKAVNNNNRPHVKKSPTPKTALPKLSKKRRSPVTQVSQSSNLSPAKPSNPRKPKTRKPSSAAGASPVPTEISLPSAQAPSPATTETDEPLHSSLPQKSVAPCKKKQISRKQRVSFAQNVQAVSKTPSADPAATTAPGETSDETMPDAPALSSLPLPPPQQSVDEIWRNPNSRARKRSISDPAAPRQNASSTCAKGTGSKPTAYYRIPRTADISPVTHCQPPTELLGPPSCLPPLPAVLPAVGAVVDSSSSHEHLLPPKLGLPPIGVYSSAPANSTCFSPVSSGNEDVNPAEPETEKVMLKCAICRKQVPSSEAVKHPGLPIVSFDICYRCNEYVKTAIRRNSSCTKNVRLGRQDLSIHRRVSLFVAVLEDIIMLEYPESELEHRKLREARDHISQRPGDHDVKRWSYIGLPYDLLHVVRACLRQFGFTIREGRLRYPEAAVSLQRTSEVRDLIRRALPPTLDHRRRNTTPGVEAWNQLFGDTLQFECAELSSCAIYEKLLGLVGFKVQHAGPCNKSATAPTCCRLALEPVSLKWIMLQSVSLLNGTPCADLIPTPWRPAEAAKYLDEYENAMKHDSFTGDLSQICCVCGNDEKQEGQFQKFNFAHCRSCTRSFCSICLTNVLGTSEYIRSFGSVHEYEYECMLCRMKRKAGAVGMKSQSSLLQLHSGRVSKAALLKRQAASLKPTTGRGCAPMMQLVVKVTRALLFARNGIGNRESVNFAKFVETANEHCARSSVEGRTHIPLESICLKCKETARCGKKSRGIGSSLDEENAVRCGHSGCINVMHKNCLPQEEQQRRRGARAKWICPHHQCAMCEFRDDSKLVRCRTCPVSYCREHLGAPHAIYMWNDRLMTCGACKKFVMKPAVSWVKVMKVKSRAKLSEVDQAQAIAQRLKEGTRKKIMHGLTRCQDEPKRTAEIELVSSAWKKHGEMVEVNENDVFVI